MQKQTSSSFRFPIRSVRGCGAARPRPAASHRTWGTPDALLAYVLTAATIRIRFQKRINARISTPRFMPF